nr:MAG TPA: hypothetical protein [Caudoviricetes sp.]
MNKRSRSKKEEPMNTSTRIILIMGIFACLFIVTMTVTFWVKNAVPDTLIQYVLGAGGVEAFLLSGIKISKVLTEARQLKESAKETIQDELAEDNPEEVIK